MQETEPLLPTEQDLRTQGAWRLLSLELSATFFREMWVPIDDVEEFQNNLRSCIRNLHAESPHYPFPGQLNALIHIHVVSKLPENDQMLLAFWIRSVYLGDGPDRLAETLWNSLTPKLVNQDELVLGTAQAMLKSAHSKKLEIRARLREKLEARARLPVSSWDKNQVAQYESGVEAIQTKIQLIASYNAFVACWKHYCDDLSFDQLRLIYETGANVAKARQMMDSGLPFPGSWQLDMLPFLRRFESTESK